MVAVFSFPPAGVWSVVLCRTVTVMPNVKRQPDIREGDVCIRCGERVRPLLDDGAPKESGEGGATSVGWTCACVTIEGPQVPVDG